MKETETKCCEKCFDEGVSQLSYGGCSNSTCPCHQETKCARCGLPKSEWKGRWQNPVCKVGETSYECHTPPQDKPVTDITKQILKDYDKTFKDLAKYDKEECYCNDDRASGSFKDGHFANCPSSTPQDWKQRMMNFTKIFNHK